MGFIWATENFFNADDATITTSSENATYPITNAYRFQRRGRVYRTQGNIEVTASNKTIKFTDSGSWTATIAEGSYLVATTFLTAIKTAMEAVSPETYTVTYTSEKKISIASTGSMVLQFSDVAFTAETILGFEGRVTNLSGATIESDFPIIHSSEWVKMDFGLPTNPQAFILFGKRNENLKYSESAVIKLQGNQTDNWTSPQFEETLSWNENVIQTSNKLGLHTEPLRYWRFYVEDKQNEYGYLEFSNLFIGQAFIPERGCAQFGFLNRLRDLSVTAYSESGVSLTDIKPQHQEFSFEFSFLTKEDVDNFMFLFEVHGTGKPFPIIMDKNLVFSVNSQDMTKYVKMLSEPDIRLVSPDNFTVSINLREEL